MSPTPRPRPSSQALVSVQWKRMTCIQFCLAFVLWLAAKHGHLLSQEQGEEADTWVVNAIKGLMVGAFSGKMIP